MYKSPTDGSPSWSTRLLNTSCKGVLSLFYLPFSYYYISLHNYLSPRHIWGPCGTGHTVNNAWRVLASLVDGVPSLLIKLRRNSVVVPA